MTRLFIAAMFLIVTAAALTGCRAEGEIGDASANVTAAR